MAKLFGTDGVRGVVNRDLTPELVFKLGQALAFYLLGRDGPIILGRDPRASGECLEAAICAGLSSVGRDVWKVGVVTTPAVAYLTRIHSSAGGVMISASHNPPEYNGIKVFAADGYKLEDEAERDIERSVDDYCRDRYPRPIGDGLGRVSDHSDLCKRYVQYLVSVASCKLHGLRVVVDCANGSASRIAPEVFSMLGADVTAVASEPDGININSNCGSTAPELLVEAVRQNGADCGLALDGDADRLIAVDDDGNIVDGDMIMAIMALARRRRGEDVRVVVGTVMTNSGLEATLAESGIVLHRTAVGDKYVLEAMRELSATLGGEQSGHIIFGDQATTGDGILTGIQLLALVKDTEMSLSKLASQVEIWPQYQRSIKVVNPEAWENCEKTMAVLAASKKVLGDLGRILVRPSGTEPVLRILVEGRESRVVEQVGRELVNAIEKFQGGGRQ